MTVLPFKEGETMTGRPRKQRPGKREIERLYVKEKRSVRETAAQLGCSKDIVYRALKEYGIKLRPGIWHRESKLQTHSLKDLRAAVKRQGTRATARDLGVCEGTLRHYLKGRKKSVK